MKQFIVTLDKDIAGNKADVRSFLAAISRFLGVLTTHLRRVSVHRGCTLIHGFACDEGVDRLYEYYLSVRAGKTKHPELAALNEFLEKWSVSRLQIHAPVEAADPGRAATGYIQHAVVFVHGWGGSIEDTFGHFPDYVQAATSTSTHVYCYPTGWLRKSPSIAFITRNLDNWIRVNTPDATHIAIVGHSLGGLVSRYLAVLQELREKPIPIRLVALIASPTDGVGFASIASCVPVLRSAQLEELRPSSGFLIDVNERWTRWRKLYTPHYARVGTMYGMNDRVVSITSAIGGDSEAVPIFEVGHLSIVKPSSSADESVKTLVRFCKEAGFGAA